MQMVNNCNSFQLKNLPPLSLYVHIPWCVKKCPYCDFNSHNLKADLPEDKYIECLIADLEMSLPFIWGRSIKTIFIGGGTPSLFSGDAINRLLNAIRQLTNLSPFAEITMEINPGTVEVKYIRDYKLAGINRVSFGIQSFNDQHLQILGRIHDSSEAIAAVKLATTIFKNINLDIIYGLPNQTVEQVLVDINQAIELQPQHISCYNLTIEPNTYFYNHVPPGLPDNDTCYIMQDAIIANLARHGYERYEISAYAKGSARSEHNLNYWLFGDYLGIGAGAHSKISFADKIIRQIRQKQPQSYMDSVLTKQHIIEDNAVLPTSIPFEFAMNAFRLIDGVPIATFSERTGLSLNSILPQLQQAQDKQLLSIENGITKPTKLGHDFLNDLLMMFLDK